METGCGTGGKKLRTDGVVATGLEQTSERTSSTAAEFLKRDDTGLSSGARAARFEWHDHATVNEG